MYPAGDETVALKAAQGLREHLLTDDGSGVAPLTEPLRARLQVLEHLPGRAGEGAQLKDGYGLLTAGPPGG
jgi:hypothetical protein